jgi:hypothetical protein
MNAMPHFPLIRVGDPIHHENLAIFPIFSSGPPTDEVDYLLSDEAVGAGSVTVEEINESGSGQRSWSPIAAITGSSSSKEKSCGVRSRTGFSTPRC